MPSLPDKVANKKILNSHIFLFLIHLELKWQIHSYTPIVPYLILDQVGANSLAVFRLKQHKNHTLKGGSYLVYGLYNGIYLGLL